MKKIFLILLGSLIALTAWSQSLSLSDLDPAELNKAGAKVLLENLGSIYIGSVVLKDGNNYAMGLKKQVPPMAQLFSQVDINKVDASKAKIAIAGPDKIYLSNLMYEGNSYSVLFVGNKSNEYAILEYSKGSENLTPYWDQIDTSKAKIAFTGKDSAKISDVMIGKSVYSLNLTFGYDFKSKSAKYQKTGAVPVPKDYDSIIAGLEKKRQQAEDVKNSIDADYQDALAKIDEKDKEIRNLNEMLANAMNQAPAEAASALDKLIVSNKLVASKFDIKKATVKVSKGTVAIKDVYYAGKPYSGTVVYNNKTQTARITQVYDGNNKPMLRSPIDFGWGQFMVIAYGYQELMSIIKPLRAQVKASATEIAKLKESAAQAGSVDLAKAQKAIAELEKIKAQQAKLTNLVLSIDPSKVDLSKATVKIVQNRVSISKLYYNNKPYGAMIRFDDQRKIANLVEVWDPIRRDKPLIGPIDLGWAEFKIAAFGYKELLSIIKALKASVAGEVKEVIVEKIVEVPVEVPVKTTSRLDELIIKQKLVAKKFDISKATLSEANGTITIKNLAYAGKPYFATMVNDNAARKVQITQIYDAAKQPLLKAPVAIGWGEFQIASYAYKELISIIKSLRKGAPAAAEVVALEKEIAELKEGLAKCKEDSDYYKERFNNLRVKLEEIKAKEQKLINLVLKINPDKIDITKAIAKKVDNRISISNIYYGKKQYGAMIRFDDQRKIANLVEIWDPVKKVKLVSSPIDLGWVQFKAGELGYIQLKGVIDQLRAALKQAKAEAASLGQKVAALEKEVAMLSRKAPVAGDYPKVLLSGLAGGMKLMGTWKMDGKSLSQTDLKQFFAKQGYKVIQDQNELVYGFTAKGSNVDKEGYGLHFLVDNTKTGVGYGLGDSYLVWVTRDDLYKNYESKATYLMLYKSHTDTSMKELASVVIPEPITDALDIVVKYTNAKITVYVNGTERLVYAVSGAKKTGTGVALRTMKGPITFSDLYVRTK